MFGLAGNFFAIVALAKARRVDRNGTGRFRKTALLPLLFVGWGAALELGVPVLEVVPLVLDPGVSTGSLLIRRAILGLVSSVAYIAVLGVLPCIAFAVVRRRLATLRREAEPSGDETSSEHVQDV